MASLEVEYIMRGCFVLSAPCKTTCTPHLPTSHYGPLVRILKETWQTHILRRIIWAPRNKSDLGPRSLATRQIILNIVDSIATADALLALAVLALGAEQFVAEHVIVGLVGRLFHHDLFPVVADLVDYPFEVFAELQLVELADAVRVYGDTVGPC
jgi:hypothetical protein